MGKETKLRKNVMMMAAVAAMTACGAVPPQIFKPGSFILFQGDEAQAGAPAGE